MIKAEQAVYTRVEPFLSPQGKTGYQLVWCSPGLKRVQLEKIEGIVRMHVNLRMPRLQFFNVDTSHMAVCQTHSHEPHPQIDRLGRRAFFVHILVFKSQSFLNWGANPFTLLKRGYFLNSLEQAIERFGPKQPAKMLEIDKLQETEETLPESPSRDLVVLAYSAKALKESSQRVYLHGPEPEVRALLENLFAHLAPEQRIAFTFSTQADNVSNEPYIFCCSGVLQPEPCEIVRTLNLGKVSLLEPNFPGLLFRDWLIQQAELPKHNIIASMYDVLAWLESDQLTLPATIETKTLMRAAHYHSDLIKKKLVTTLKPYIGSRSGNKAARWMMNSKPLEELYEVFRRNRRVLGKFLFHWQATNKPLRISLLNKHLRDIAKDSPLIDFLQQQLWLPFSKPKLVRDVQAMTVAEYEVLLEHHQNVGHEHLIHDHHLKTLANHQVLDFFPDRLILHVKKRITELGLTGSFPVLEKRIQRMAPRYSRQLNHEK